VMSDSPQDKKDLAFFHLQSHPLFWNDVARQLSNESPRGLAQTARIFACLNTAIMDAYVGAWYAKWKVYFKWRPITAIRLADTDDNDFTKADAGWEALSATPPHPTYPSGHGSAAGAGSYVLRKFFGEHGHALTMMSPTAPGVVLHYSRLRAVTDDVQDARVYLGIHFRFDTEAGDRLGSETGAFVFHHAFRRIDRDDDDVCDWEP